MCFSATASFASSAILAGVGAASVTKVERKEEYALAAVPCFFAFQQFMEGIVWLKMGTGIGTAAGYVFLVFAMMIWPLWIPLTSYLVERNKERKKWMLPFVAIGAVIFVTILVRMFTKDLTISLFEHHVSYKFDGLDDSNAWTWFYVAAVCVTPFLNTNKLIKAIGVIAFVTYMVSVWWFSQVYVSVWCFFAAVVSFSVLFYFKSDRKELKK